MSAWMRAGALLVAGAVVAGAASLAEPVAEAQCKRACGPGEVRDGHGCCQRGPKSAPPARPRPPAPSPPARPAPPPPPPVVEVALPGGQFTMGERGDQVTVSAFHLDATEVTLAAYGVCVSGGRCSRPDTGGDCNWGVAGRGDHPVNCVDFHQATAYCRSQRKRLPTEEEWEWAARGASQGTAYPWGNEAPGGQLCWNGAGNSAGKGKRTSTCPVGSFLGGDSPQDLKDLAGNVWEWTSSQWDPRDATNTARVYRGGGFSGDSPSLVRAAFRHWNVPGFRHHVVGFRCARAG